MCGAVRVVCLEYGADHVEQKPSGIRIVFTQEISDLL